MPKTTKESMTDWHQDGWAQNGVVRPCHVATFAQMRQCVSAT
jgi:hypothetical protein